MEETRENICEKRLSIFSALSILCSPKNSLDGPVALSKFCSMHQIYEIFSISLGPHRYNSQQTTCTRSVSSILVQLFIFQRWTILHFPLPLHFPLSRPHLSWFLSAAPLIYGSVPLLSASAWFLSFSPPLCLSLPFWPSHALSLSLLLPPNAHTEPENHCLGLYLL